MGCFGNCVAGTFSCIIRWIISILQIGICIAIVVIVSTKLSNYEWFQRTGSSPQDVDVVDYQCLLGTDAEGRDLCTYTYIVVGVSFVGNFVLGLASCALCACWGLVGPWVDLVFMGLGTAWWLVAALILRANQNKQPSGLPQDQWQNTVVVLFWAMVGLFGLQALMALCGVWGQLTSCLCCCCSCCSSSRGDKNERNKQQQQQHPVHRAPPPQHVAINIPAPAGQQPSRIQTWFGAGGAGGGKAVPLRG